MLIVFDLVVLIFIFIFDVVVVVVVFRVETPVSVERGWRL